jgi:nicotinate-nucleotide adenylyltransferase
MKVGLFGGSFDPIHRGHVEPVQAARRALGLDRVLYLPTAQPPHKPKRQFAPALARFAMVELALLGEEGLYASPHELTLGRASYTIDTLDHFRSELPEAELHLLLGSDSFLDLPHWRRWRRLPELARLVVLARPGWMVDGQGRREAGDATDELRRLLASDRVTVVEQAPVDLSASAIRGLLAAGEEPPPGALAPLVLEYVRKYRLYR